MLLAVVKGRAISTIKHESLEGTRLLLVETIDANGEVTVTGPLPTSMTPAQGHVHGSHMFATNGIRLATVCLDPTDVPGTVCEQQPVDIIDATKVTTLVTPVEVNSLPAQNFVYVYNVNVTNVAPEGWDGLDALGVEVLIDIPPNMLPNPERKEHTTSLLRQPLRPHPPPPAP